jgi:hypothetical protein
MFVRMSPPAPTRLNAQYFPSISILLRHHVAEPLNRFDDLVEVRGAVTVHEENALTAGSLQRLEHDAAFPVLLHEPLELVGVA